MRIKQCSAANSANFFKKNLFERWDFEEYNNPYQPCFFFGANSQIDLINNHKGLKIVYFIDPHDCTFSNQILYSDNLFFINSPFLKNTGNVKVKNIEIEIKNYQMFQPNRFGNKIYTYIGWEYRVNEFNLDLIKQIGKHVNYEVIFGIQSSLNDYIDISQVKREYYDNCFVNLNLSNGTGMTTVRELGLMGRKTIMNTGYNFPSIIKYKDFDDIIRLINQESKKIGTLNEKIDCHNVGDEWLDTFFWENHDTYYNIIQMRNNENTDGLLNFIENLPDKLVMAEIGCYTGESTKYFLDSGKIEKLYAVDLWNDPSNIYSTMVSNHNFESVENVFNRRLENYNFEKKKGSFKEVFDELPELDLVYIDANHEYHNVCEDIELSLKKVKKGGIIGGHDYNLDTPGVIDAVNKYFENVRVFSDSSWMVIVN